MSNILKASLVLCSLFLFASLSADSTFTYTISYPNLALSPYTGPYATVTVDLNSPTTATITFSSLNNGGNTYLMGATSSADLNINANSWSISNLVGTNSISGFSTPSLSDAGSGNLSQFGNFNETINSSSGFTKSSNQISLFVTDTSGSWSSANAVLIPNADGYITAVHAFVCQDTCTAAEGASTSGFAGGQVPVPEPSTYLILVSFLGFVFLLKPKNNKISSKITS